MGWCSTLEILKGAAWFYHDTFHDTSQTAGLQAMLISCNRADAGIVLDLFLQERLNLLLKLRVEPCFVCSVLSVAAVCICPGFTN